MNRVLIILVVVLIGCDKSLDVPVNTIDGQSAKFGEFIDNWTFSVYPKPHYNFEVAEFRLWVPENINDLQGVLILCHSYNSNGLGLADSKVWQEFAALEKLCLLGVHFKNSRGSSVSDYSDAFGGSGSILIKSLGSIADKNNLPEIKQLPFLLRGYSAGGAFSVSFSDYKSDRVIAFASLRGAGVYMNTVDPSIPALFLVGEKDYYEATKKRFVSKRVKEDALWTFAIEPGADHFASLSDSDSLARTFFSSTLDKRTTNDPNNALIRIDSHSGWLGNNSTKEIFAFQSYPYEKKMASWLIDEKVANQWKSYQNK